MGNSQPKLPLKHANDRPWWIHVYVSGEEKPRKYYFNGASDASLTINDILAGMIQQFQLPPLDPLVTMKFYCLKETNNYYYTPRLNGSKRLGDYHIIPSCGNVSNRKCLYLTTELPVT